MYIEKKELFERAEPSEFMSLDEQSLLKSAISEQDINQGKPNPLGVFWHHDSSSYNFAVYSKTASKITLLFYTADELTQPAKSITLDYLQHKTHDTWHCRVDENALDGIQYYAYSMEGPIEGRGDVSQAFQKDKILLDPYTKAVHFPADFDAEAACLPGSNAGKAPLGLLNKTAACGIKALPYQRHQRHELIIYEMHVKGFTRNANSGIKQSKLGTYAGVIDKIDHLKKLGITAVELMPIYQREPNASDYWGYNPLNFFSPEGAYAESKSACGQHQEFKAMVQALHDADIDVILDVVYNHTCEGNHKGPTYSYKGIDNSSYYILSKNSAEPYMNFSGTGNTFNSEASSVRRVILDSLRYWVTEMGVDGFRFDLASIFSRTSDGSIDQHRPALFDQIAADPVLSSVHLIGEPWDMGSYQLGQAFPGVRWSQWNGRYRDSMQKFIRSDPNLVATMMSNIYGSCDLFPDSLALAYRPFQSINYFSSHDGFSLYDQVSYDHKRNWANGEDNNDGSTPYSWNCGAAENDGDDNITPEIEALRSQQARNFITLLMLSNGAPMFRMGDEFLHTQGGNNNPYNQDNDTSWLDWNRAKTHASMTQFFSKLIQFRKENVSIGRPGFWREDIQWFGVNSLDVDLSYDSHSFAYHLSGKGVGGKNLYVMINTYWEPLNFTVQIENKAWIRVIDTSLSVAQSIRLKGPNIKLKNAQYLVKPRSVVVLMEK